MTGWRAKVATAALVAIACGTASAPRPVPTAAGALPTLDDCAALPDRDADGMSDACEVAFAEAFAPILLQSAGDCAFDTTRGRIDGGYLHAAQPDGPDRVRVAYLPAYLTDCGWEGTKCLLPGVDCRAHAGDSEFIVVEAQADGGTWRMTGVFLSAHCFDGNADDCRWRREAELAEVEWDGLRPVVWVAHGRHANYPTRAACDRGHYFLDTCDAEPSRVAFPVSASRNVGSAIAPRCADLADVARPADAEATECPWTDARFTGWQFGAAGATGYRRYLDEIAGFIAPIDRLAWLAGCWAQRSDRTLTEEQWMAPRGGSMLGMSRVVRGDRTIAHEAMRIEERGERLAFVARPSGQAEAEFLSVSVTDSTVAFENPAHDFPQRILYRHTDGDSLHARIEGVSAGIEQGVDFRMERVECNS